MSHHYTETDIQRLLKENEYIFHGSIDAIFLVEVLEEGKAGFVVRRVNKSYEKNTGLSQEWISGKTIPEIVGPEIAPQVEDNYHRLLKERRTISYEESFPMPAGTKFWRTVLNPVFDENQRIIYLVGVSSDITPQKMIEKEILGAKNEAERANNAKGMFLANMSHEIRTPLNGILGFSDLLRQSPLNETQVDYVRNIQQSATNLLQIVNQILDFSKIDSGKLELERVGTSLPALCQFLLKSFSYQAKSKSLDLSLHIDPNLPPFVYLDPLRLKQVLNNLISNSIKFTETGFVRLDVKKISEKPNNRAEIEFSIQDSGIGIDPSKLEHLFDSFTQADLSTSRKYGGTGLGLPILASLLKLMGSAIHVESELGKGSKFFFRLDLEISEKEDPSFIDQFLVSVESEPVGEIPTPESENNFAFEQSIVVVADDNEMNRSLLRSLLQKKFPQLRIVEASDGKETVEKFHLHSPSLILMDVQMPIKDGYSATKDIRILEEKKMLPRTPIIAVTAGALQGDREKCLEVGMDDFLTKPISSKLLAEVVTRYLNLSKSA